MRIATLITFLLVPALLYALAVPLVRRRVPPNPGYGLRVPPTFADESVWYDANEATARDMQRLAIGVAALAVAAFFVPLSDEAYTLALAGALLAGVVTLCIHGWRRASRILRERRGTGQRSPEE